MTSLKQPIELWLELASTYSYLAVNAIQSLEAPVVIRPFLLGPIFAAQGWNNSPFNIYPAKGKYMWRDMERLCADAGLPFQRPSQFPRGSLLASRIAVMNQDAPWVADFYRALYRANFAEDRNIADPNVVGEVLTQLGLDASTLLTLGETREAKQALKDQTNRAMTLGIFGAPTFVVGTELFWGSDRLAQAVAYWRKHG